MALNAKALGLSGAILWAAGFLIMTILAATTGYLKPFAEIMMKAYPGYELTAVGTLIGIIYALIDAFVGFFLIGWLYNKLEKIV